MLRQVTIVGGHLQIKSSNMAHQLSFNYNFLAQVALYTKYDILLWFTNFFSPAIKNWHHKFGMFSRPWHFWLMACRKIKPVINDHEYNK